MVAMSNDGLAQTVREHGGRMTRQCQIILDTLASVDCHPTAGELHEMVRRRLPGISQGTVYRNLRRLQELGYVLELDYGAGRRISTRSRRTIMCAAGAAVGSRISRARRRRSWRGAGAAGLAP